MRGLCPTHRLATHAPAEPPATPCAQCGRETGSSPSGYWCSETCMRRWLRAGTRHPEEVLGSDAAAVTERMARRYAYLVATTGSWPEAWRIYCA